VDEIELKFVVPTEEFSSLESALRQDRVSVRRMQAFYFDTADERLGRHGVAVRLREEGREWVQTAKARTPDALHRLEHNVEVEVPRGMRQPQLDLARHDGEPVGEAVRRALADPADGGAAGALSERYSSDVCRIARTVRVRGASVELSLDRGTICAGNRSAPVSEFELELKSGRVDALVSLAAAWADRHRLWLSTISKAERGARLARGESEGLPVRAGTVSVEPRASMRTFLHASMTSCLAQILGNASEIGAGAADEEFVHQLRIGLRRLRTALRELKAMRYGADPGWETALRVAFQELGRHRDRAIVLPAVRAELAAAGVATVMQLDAERGPASNARSPGQLVRAAGFQHTLLGLLAFAHDDETAAAGAGRKGKPARAKVARRLEALHRLLARDAKRFARLDSRRQHRVRKRLKRLRYLSEFAAPLFSAAEVAQYLARWGKAQDALGDCNDHRIATAAFRADVPRHPEAQRAVHWLAGQRTALVERCRIALRKASRKRPFWRS